MIENRDIVCISSMDYEEHMTAKQQVMKLLSRKNRVLYCQREVGLEHLLKHPQMVGKVFKKMRRPVYEVDGMKAAYLPLLLPGRYYSHAINNMNQSYLAGYVKGLIKDLGFRAPILWTFQPHSAPLFRAVPASARIYHCAENYNVMAEGRKRRIMAEEEAELCAASDLVFCVTDGIYQKISAIAPEKAHLIYNGVDHELFKRAASVHPDPPDLAGVGRPRLLHMGMINGKVDMDLLLDLAQRHSEWNLVLIGDVFYSDIDVVKFTALTRMPNVRSLGMKKVDDLPPYLANCDVCLIAGKRNEWTKITKPLKSYEYLSSGKPVVSIGFPELRTFERYFSIAESGEEYEKCIGRILAGERTSSIEDQIAFAAGHSWESRVEEMSEKIFRFIGMAGQKSKS